MVRRSGYTLHLCVGKEFDPHLAGSTVAAKREVAEQL